ncbi:hypothetical protein Tco_0267696 [Tanacetum coccineum]
MMVQAQEEMGKSSANPTDPHHTPIITQPSTSQPQKKQKPRKSKRKDLRFLPHLLSYSEPIAVKVLDLETSKTTQALEIESLKRRMKKLKKKQRSRNHKLRRLYKVGLSAKVVSSDDEASLGDQEDASKQRPVLMLLITTTTTAITTVADEVEMTLAQTLIEIKNAKPKAKGIVMLQQEEQEELTIEEKSKLFSDNSLHQKGGSSLQLESKKEEQDHQLSQQRYINVTYLKNMEGWKPKDLKTNSKRAGDELEQEKAKKQKIDDDQEEAKMKELMKVVSDEEGVAIDAIPLSC